jgi:hypothetical protein
VGLRAVLDAVAKRKIPSPRWESNPRCCGYLVGALRRMQEAVVDYFQALNQQSPGRTDENNERHGQVIRYPDGIRTGSLAYHSSALTLS